MRIGCTNVAVGVVEHDRRSGVRAARGEDRTGRAREVSIDREGVRAVMDEQLGAAGGDPAAGIGIGRGTDDTVLASEPASKPPEARVSVSSVVPVKETVVAPWMVRELIVWPPLVIVAFAAMRRLLVATEAEKVPVCSTLLIWRMPVTAS